MSENVLSIISLNSILVFPGEKLVDASWLEQDYLINIIKQLKQLASKHIDLHDDSVGDLLGLILGKSFDNGPSLNRS